MHKSNKNQHIKNDKVFLCLPTAVDMS